MDGSTQNPIVSFVGIDVSKAKFDVRILPAGTHSGLREYETTTASRN